MFWWQLIKTIKKPVKLDRHQDVWLTSRGTGVPAEVDPPPGVSRPRLVPRDSLPYQRSSPTTLHLRNTCSHTHTIYISLLTSPSANMLR